MNSEQKFPYDFIGKVLISQQEIETRVNQLGEIISEDTKTRKSAAAWLLRGSVMFVTDLMRKVQRP